MYKQLMHLNTRKTNNPVKKWAKELNRQFSKKDMKVKEEVKLLSRVWLFATPWTVAHQAPQAMEFSRQEYWSGLPFPSPLVSIEHSKFIISMKEKFCATWIYLFILVYNLYMILG